MGDPEYIASRPYSGSPNKSYNTSDTRRIYTGSIRSCEVSKHPLPHSYTIPVAPHFHPTSSCSWWQIGVLWCCGGAVVVVMVAVIVVVMLASSACRLYSLFPPCEQLLTTAVGGAVVVVAIVIIVIVIKVVVASL